MLTVPYWDAYVHIGGKPAFAITTVKKKYLLAVDTDKVRSMWLEALLDAITQWHAADTLKRATSSPSTGTPGQRRRKEQP